MGAPRKTGMRVRPWCRCPPLRAVVCVRGARCLPISQRALYIASGGGVLVLSRVSLCLVAGAFPPAVSLTTHKYTLFFEYTYILSKYFNNFMYIQSKILYFCAQKQHTMEEKKNNEKKVGRGGKRPGAGRKAPDGRKTKHLNFAMTPKFWEKLQEFAQNENTNVSDFLRKLVFEYERNHLERTRTAQEEPQN